MKPTQIVAFTLLIISCQAETIDQVVADLTPKIATLKRNIDLELQTAGTSIREARSTIGRTINTGEVQILQKLNELDTTIQEARQQAQNKQVDISKCVNEASTSLSQLDLGRIHSCSEDKSLDLLGVKLDDLRRLKHSLSNSINICMQQHSQNAADLRSCVESDIKSGENQVDQASSQIHNVCQNGKDNAQKCVNNTVEELVSSVNNISQNFTNCVSQII